VVWRRQLLCYIFRSKDVEPGQRPAYELTEGQQMAIDDVWREEQGDTEREREGFSDEEMERKVVVGRSSSREE
jgi:hypothetical protein